MTGFWPDLRHFSALRSAHFSALDGTQFLLCVVEVPCALVVRLLHGPSGLDIHPFVSSPR